MPTKILATANNTAFMFMLWGLLFIATIISSNLDMRTLLTAFFAWTGGLISTILGNRMRQNREWKDLQSRELETRTYVY